MPLGTSLVNDLIPDMQNGHTVMLTSAQLSTKYGSGNIKTPSANFAIMYKGQHVQFVKNVPLVVDSGLATALSNAGAPVS